MSGKRKWYYDLETGTMVRFEPQYRVVPRTPEERRSDIIDRFRLRSQGVDESWVVFGENGTRKLVAPEEQRRVQREQHRLNIAKRYGVPVSWVMLEHKLASWRTTRATAKPRVGFLSNLRSHAQSSLKACSQVLAILLPWAGKS